MTNQNLIVAGVVVAGLLIGIIGYTQLGRITPPAAPGTVATSTAMGTTTTPAAGVAGSAQTLKTGSPAPSLTGPVLITGSFDAAAKAVVRKHLDESIAAIKKDPLDAQAWLDLAIYRKIAGDYQGAAEVWQYVAKTGTPEFRAIAYGDLGDLYLSFMVDHAKAEANYKQAIALNPQDTDYYRNLVSLYKETNRVAEARALVSAGLKLYPQNPDLLAIQSSL